MVRSSGFGSVPNDLITLRLLSSSLSLWLRFLNPAIRYKSPAHSSTGTQSGLTTRSPSAACRLLVSCSFHSPPGVLFTFPSRYWFTIGHSGIFSLARWSLRIHTEFHVLHATRESEGMLNLSTSKQNNKLILTTRLSLSKV
jgi:hypothetical protein